MTHWYSIIIERGFSFQMRTYATTDVNDHTIMLTMLNKKIPQAIIIKNFSVSAKVKKLIVDTTNKDHRFIELSIDKDTRKPDWNSRKVVEVSEALKERSDQLLSQASA